MADLGPVAWPPDPIRTEGLVLRAPESRDRTAIIELKLGFTEVERLEAYGAEQWFGVRSTATPTP